jgi:site-specific recombinase XerD
LKDSGITDLLNAGVAPKVVQHHAGHSSIEQTMEYDHKDFNIYKDTILNLQTQFSQKKADHE